jgi:hypothetical protein
LLDIFLLEKGYLGSCVGWLTNENNLGKVQSFMVFNTLFLTGIWYWFQWNYATDPISYVATLGEGDKKDS